MLKYSGVFPSLQKSCVPGVRKSVGTLSTAIEFMAKTFTSFRLIRWVYRRHHVDTFLVESFLEVCCPNLTDGLLFFLLFRYEHARSGSAWSITTCGRSPNVTSTLPSRPPGSAERSSACNQGACEYCWNTNDEIHSRGKNVGETDAVRRITPERKHESANRLCLSVSNPVSCSMLKALQCAYWVGVSGCVRHLLIS